jgi:hypothetical protein
VPEATELSNGTGSGLRITDWEGDQILLSRTAIGTRDMGFGDRPIATAVLVVLVLDSDQPEFHIKGEVTIPQTVIVTALEEKPVIVGTLERPGKAFRLRELDDVQLAAARGMWAEMSAEIDAWRAANSDTEQPGF